MCIIYLFLLIYLFILFYLFLPIFIYLFKFILILLIFVYLHDIHYLSLEPGPRGAHKLLTVADLHVCTELGVTALSRLRELLYSCKLHSCSEFFLFNR
jgi:hypothetical protein